MNSNSIVYTTLDSLYDTKLATYGLLDHRLSKEYFKDEHKLVDQCLYITDSVFKRIYAKRDKNTLLNSKTTSVIDLLRQFSGDVVMKNKMNNTNFSLELHINTYPYVLTDEEKKYMSVFYRQHILYLKDVILLYEDMDTKSTSSINKINLLILDNGIDWLLSRLSREPKFKSPSTRLISSDKISNRNKLKQLNVDEKDVYNYISSTMLPIITLEVIEDETFKLLLE